MANYVTPWYISDAQLVSLLAALELGKVSALNITDNPTTAR